MKKSTVGAAVFVAAALFVLAGCGSGKSANANRTGRAMASAAAESNASGAPYQTGTIPDCGATKAVWVNLNTKVYHEPDDPAYGRTKHGEYLCPTQATAQGFHAPGQGRHRRHHRKEGSEEQNP